MLCSNCLLEIEDNSTYCDQCGKPVMICSECGYTGTVKTCPNDGMKLTLNNDVKNYLARNFFKTEREKSSVQASTIPVLKLSNRALDVNLEVMNNDILGRTTGKFAQRISGLKQLSSKHVSFLFGKEGWIVTDLGSTNGTKINGKQLIPMQPEKIKPGDLLILANIEFYVSINE